MEVGRGECLDDSKLFRVGQNLLPHGLPVCVELNNGGQLASDVLFGDDGLGGRLFGRRGDYGINCEDVIVGVEHLLSS